MVKKSKRELYSGVSIPIDLMNEIEEYRNEHPEKKYRSRAEFIIEAIRDKLDRQRMLSYVPYDMAKPGAKSIIKKPQFNADQIEYITTIVVRTIQKMNDILPSDLKSGVS